MAAFLREKGKILWDVTLDTGYVQPMNFLAPGSRDMFDANNKAVDYLFRAPCQSEFDQVHAENLACRIWMVLKEAHVGNAQVQAEGPIRRPEWGIEWEPIKILIQRENSAYAPKSQPRIPTRVCQGRVVTADLPTLGTYSKQSQSGSTNQEAKDLATLRSTRQTFRELWADCP
jgi:hypothetical protein